MKLGWGGSCAEGGLGFIASFSLCPAFPIQAYAVVTSLALSFTVFTFWSFFSALDLSVLAGPVVVQQWSVCRVFSAYQQPLRLRFLGSALPGFLGRGMAMCEWRRKPIKALGCCSFSFELALGECSGGNVQSGGIIFLG